MLYSRQPLLLYKMIICNVPKNNSLYINLPIYRYINLPIYRYSWSSGINYMIYVKFLIIMIGSREKIFQQKSQGGP